MLLLFLVGALAAPLPALLACTPADRADAWVTGAQDNVLLTLQTLFGGFNCTGHLVDACFEKAELMDAVTCVSTVADCDDCDLEAQLAITDECCEETEPTVDGDSICRTNRQWIAIAFDKMGVARRTLDTCINNLECVDECHAAACENATQFACAASAILEAVLVSLDSEFLAVAATYRHILSPRRTVVFDGTDVVVSTQTIQSFRDCTTPVCRNHALVATYTVYSAHTAGLPPGTHQLLWPIGGRVGNFDRTGLPVGHCSLAEAETTHVPADDPALRLSTLGHLDFARVIPSFQLCGGFPCAGCVRTFNDLSPARCCNTLPIMPNIGAAAQPVDDGFVATSTSYVAHYRSAVTYESQPTRDVRVDLKLLVRVAAADMCVDYDVLATTPASALFNTTNRIATLAPGESKCIGGSASGQLCTERNACGTGMACTARPGGGTYCFDGSWWNAAMPCSGAQCPFGECYGAVSGDEGGAYPYLHVWNENHCDNPLLATSICQDERVREWYNTPNE